MDTVYCITGATGFIGCGLVQKLVSEGKTVRALARSKEKAEKTLGQFPAAEVFFGDVRNVSDIARMLGKSTPDTQKILIHAAALVLIGGSRKERREMREINIRGLQNAIDACIESGAKLLYISSVHAIPELKKRNVMTEISDFDPKKVIGGYARTKALGSRMVTDAIRERGLRAVIVHPSGVTGPGDYGNGLLTQMIRDYKQNKIPAAVKGGYDFVDVRDVCDGILSAIDRFENGQRYLLSNRYYSVKEILDILHELTGGKKIKTVLPVWVARLGLPFCSLAAKLKGTRPLYTGYSLYTLKSNANFDHSHATQKLDFHPRDLRESLKDAVAFLESEDACP